MGFDILAGSVARFTDLFSYIDFKALRVRFKPKMNITAHKINTLLMNPAILFLLFSHKRESK